MGAYGLKFCAIPGFMNRGFEHSGSHAERENIAVRSGWWEISRHLHERTVHSDEGSMCSCAPVRRTPLNLYMQKRGPIERFGTDATPMLSRNLHLQLSVSLVSSSGG
jgi:hypothetical protein